MKSQIPQCIEVKTLKKNNLTFPRYVFEEMIQHCKTELPNEACGIVSGVNGEVTSVWRLKNESKSEKRYFVGKESVQKTFNKIFHKGEIVLGIYHSHPKTSPIPSKFDLINHPYQDVKMIIVSFKKVNPVTKCYVIENRSSTESILIVN